MAKNSILEDLDFSMGANMGRAPRRRSSSKLARFAVQHPIAPLRRLDLSDAPPITFGDQFREPGIPRCAACWLSATSSSLGRSPACTPALLRYSSDDGFR